MLPKLGKDLSQLQHISTNNFNELFLKNNSIYYQKKNKHFIVAWVIFLRIQKKMDFIVPGTQNV